MADSSVQHRPNPLKILVRIAIVSNPLALWGVLSNKIMRRWDGSKRIHFAVVCSPKKRIECRKKVVSNRKIG
jgi:hypothetical protein